MKKVIFFDLLGTLEGDIRNFDFYSFAIDAIKLANDNGY